MILKKNLSKAAKTIIPNTNIKYCIWHYKKSLEIKKNKLCYNEVKNNNNIFIYYCNERDIQIRENNRQH